MVMQSVMPSIATFFTVKHVMKKAPIHQKIGIIIAEVSSCQGYCSIQCMLLGWQC